MEDLARHSGATVRTIRAYQDRGLLPRPGRRGRANLYDDSHLTRLRQISALLERGYTLASIKELLAAWDEGRGLSGVLGLVSEVEGPWSDEEPERLTQADLDELFGAGSARGDGAVAEAVELGVLVPLPERPGEYLVPSPQELAVAAELHRAGVPLLALTEHLRELRAQVEHIAARFMDFTDQHIFGRCPHTRPSDEEATEAAGLVRRLRPLAKQTVDAELARAMRTFASRSLREHLRRADAGAEGRGEGEEEGEGAEDEKGAGVGEGEGAPQGQPTASPSTAAPAAVAPAAAPPAATIPATATVRLPSATVAAVRDLVGPEQTAAFVAAAAEREVRARAMDGLAAAWTGRVERPER
ncbi:MerR family transcriptional regulator [Streptomyces winkii]|uniref:MerR family transcriptional regulator n=1 Tax=Streptomyces winkii TaxID=3051178 RepID=UPI0028D4F5AE|nr:MerR family transcriptional regulator [Streptomyces sp. DSM 40971]